MRLRKGNWRTLFFVVFALGATLGAWLATSSAVCATGSAPPDFAAMAPILQKNCLACHASATKLGGLIVESYDSLMKGGKDGAVIVPGKSDSSKLVEMLEGKIQPRMPFNSDPLPAADIAAIKAWIDAGAKGPSAGEASTALKPIAIPDIKPEVQVASPVTSLEFSPDGTILAVGGYKEVRLMDPATGKVLATLGGHADYVRSIAFSPDGKELAAAGGPPQRGGEIKVWDVATHQLLKTMHGHTDCIYSVAWSPDGKLLASGSYDKLIKLWDAATGNEIRTLKDHIDAVFAVAFSPEGKWLASGSQDRSVKVWDVTSGQRLYTLGEPLDGINTIAFSPSGKQIAAAGFDKTIYIWNLGEKNGTLQQSLIADEDSILSLAWSPDGKVLVSSSADDSIRFRDAATLNPLSVLENQPDWVEALAISPDGKRLAAGRFNGTLSLYDMSTSEQVLGPTLAFEPYKPSAPSASQNATEAPHSAERAQAGEVH